MPSSDHPVHALPTLPPEVILAIIRHNLAAPTSYVAVAARYPPLLVYSLVSRTWRALAQAELFSHVLLKDGESARRFVAACSGAEALGRMTVELRLGWEVIDVRSRAPASVICEPISAGIVPRIRKAWLKAVEPISLAMFSKSLELHTLNLSEVKLVKSWQRVPRNTIPNLRHLYMGRCTLVVSTCDPHPTAITTFLANALPHLASFSSCQSYALDSDRPTPLDFASGAAAGCHTLTIDVWWKIPDASCYWTAQLPKFTALKRLAFAEAQPFHLDDNKNTATLLAAVPTELEVLRLPHMSTSALAGNVTKSVLQILDLDLPSLRKLRRLIFTESVAAAAATRADTTRFMLRKRCAVLGIDLVEVVTSRPQHCHDGQHEWDTYDEGW